MNTNTKPHLKDYRWTKGKPSPNHSGRPKSLKNVLRDEYQITPSQTNDILSSIMMHTKKEITDIQGDDTQPMIIRIVCKALIKSYNNGSLYALESLLNRTHGMPKQQTTIDTNQENPIFVSLDLK